MMDTHFHLLAKPLGSSAFGFLVLSHEATVPVGNPRDNLPS